MLGVVAGAAQVSAGLHLRDAELAQAGIDRPSEARARAGRYRATASAPSSAALFRIASMRSSIV